jgi:DAPG hydrolase PhiG domain
MRFAEANDLLKPGYLPFESGYLELEDGKWVVAALTRMPGVRAKMVDWWFSFCGDIEWYRLWHPTEHVSSAWENRIDGRYIGASHIVEEYFGGRDGPLHKRRIQFHEPAETFDAEAYGKSGHLAICARNGPLEGAFATGRMCHFVRNIDVGCEMRSRFWLGEISARDGVTAISLEDARALRGKHLDREFARRLHQHCVEEMGYLAEVLPTLYRRVTVDNAF